MIEIKDDLKRMIQTLDPDVLRKAQVSTITRLRSRTAALMSRAGREKYNVTAKTVSDALSRRIKIVVGPDQVTGYLHYIGRRIGLINFGGQFKTVRTARGKRFGATTKLYKKQPRFLTKRGFIARGRGAASTGGNVHIYQREKGAQTSRLPIMALYGPSIPQMIGSKEVIEKANEFVKEQYPIELMHQINYRLSKL